jgi:hypothetical protein
MGVRHGEAIVSADEVLISQVIVPTVVPVTARRRARPDAASAVASRYFGGPAAALAANQLCLSLLRHAAGLNNLDPEHEPGAVRLDLRTAQLVAR